MLWETLVTDGHVRAARLRRVQPALIAIGLILVWAGFLIAKSGPEIATTGSVPGKLQERLQKQQQRVSLAFRNLAPSALSGPALAALPPTRELPELVETIQRSLDADGDLPTDDVDFVEMDVDDFWNGDWPAGQVAYAEAGGTYLFGALVQRRYGTSGQPLRWMGAMKRFGSRWQYTTLAARGVEGPPGAPVTMPEQLAVSLADLVPDPPEEPGQPNGRDAS